MASNPMRKRFSVKEAIYDCGGTHDCRRRGCGGALVHIYSDDAESVEGLCCSRCDYATYLKAPLSLAALSSAAPSGAKE